MSVRINRFEAAWAVSLALILTTTGSLLIRADEPLPPPKAVPVAKLSLQQAVDIALRQQPNVLAAIASRNSTITQKQGADSPLAMLAGPVIHVRRKQAELGVGVAQAQVEQAELDTVNAVTRTYLMVVYATDQYNVATETVARFKALYDVASQGVEKGDLSRTTKTDVQRIETYRLLAESRQAEAEAGIYRAKAALREAVGLPCDYPIEIVDQKLWYHPAKLCSCDCIVKVALNYRPEMRQALLAAEIACLEIEAQRLSFSCTYVKTFAATSDIHAKILPATEMNGTYRPGPLGPEMPVFLAGAKRIRVCRAKDLHERFLAVVEKARGLIALEAEEVCRRFVEQSKQVQLLSRAAEQSFKQARDSETAYKADQLGADQMLAAQVLESQTKARYNEALFSYSVALASLHRVSGGHYWECAEKEPAKTTVSGEVIEETAEAPQATETEEGAGPVDGQEEAGKAEDEKATAPEGEENSNSLEDGPNVMKDDPKCDPQTQTEDGSATPEGQEPADAGETEDAETAPTLPEGQEPKPPEDAIAPGKPD